MTLKIATLGLTSVLTLSALAWTPTAQPALGEQESSKDKSQSKSPKQDQDPADKLPEALTNQSGGKIGDEPQDNSMQHEHGNLIRPLVTEGGSGPATVEEGTFTLAPGDLLELECAAPKDQPNNMSYKVEDDKILKLLPTGVRKLTPMSMIGGEPKPITGMLRYVALFQAEAEGDTIIRLTVGRNQYQYKIKVAKNSDPSSSGEGKRSKENKSSDESK